MNPDPNLSCPGCSAVLPEALFNKGVSTCPSCGRRLRADVFPVFSIIQPARNGEALMNEHESSCFYHSQNKAAVSCSGCGKFLCQLCDIDFGGKHLCPQCVQTGKKKKKIRDLENQRVLYDDIALATAIIPAIFIFFTIISAPIALFLSIRHWNSPTSIIPRSRFRFVLASVLAFMQISGWVVLIGYYIYR